ncbi:DUF2514 family protein [Sphingobium sp. HT1-2]|uniref:DUF2514 family protein n=1 Tax=Sphingobium sp. HT1-2 TaxID=3111640 RepID=UPI003C10551F
MSRILDPIRPYLWAAALALAGVAIWGAYSHGVSNERGRWEKAQDKEAAARAAQQKANDDESARRLTTQKEIAENAVQERDAARDAADAAALSGERLRQQVRNLTLSLAASGARTSASGEAAAASADLLAYVQQRLDESADGIARYADEASIAGRACEASYDALTNGPVGR